MKIKFKFKFKFFLNLVPRALFPGFFSPHLQSQGKAPCGKGWFCLATRRWGGKKTSPAARNEEKRLFFAGYFYG